MGKCLVCRPKLRSTEGGDHTGRDWFLRCLKCGTRTTHHVEANYPGEAEPMLRKEWRAGRIETPRRWPPAPAAVGSATLSGETK